MRAGPRYKPSGYSSHIMATSRAGFASKSVSVSEPVVSVDWLHSNLKDPDVKVIPVLSLLTDWFL